MDLLFSPKSKKQQSTNVAKRVKAKHANNGQQSITNFFQKKEAKPIIEVSPSLKKTSSFSKAIQSFSLQKSADFNDEDNRLFYQKYEPKNFTEMKLRNDIKSNAIDWFEKRNDYHFPKVLFVHGPIGSGKTLLWKLLVKSATIGNIVIDALDLIDHDENRIQEIENSLIGSFQSKPLIIIENAEFMFKTPNHWSFLFEKPKTGQKSSLLTSVYNPQSYHPEFRNKNGLYNSPPPLIIISGQNIYHESMKYFRQIFDQEKSYGNNNISLKTIVFLEFPIPSTVDQVDNLKRVASEFSIEFVLKANEEFHLNDHIIKPLQDETISYHGVSSLLSDNIQRIASESNGDFRIALNQLSMSIYDLIISRLKKCNGRKKSIINPKRTSLKLTFPSKSQNTFDLNLFRIWLLQRYFSIEIIKTYILPQQQITSSRPTKLNLFRIWLLNRYFPLDIIKQNILPKCKQIQPESFSYPILTPSYGKRKAKDTVYIGKKNKPNIKPIQIELSSRDNNHKEKIHRFSNFFIFWNQFFHLFQSFEQYLQEEKKFILTDIEAFIQDVDESTLFFLLRNKLDEIYQTVPNSFNEYCNLIDQYSELDLTYGNYSNPIQGGFDTKQGIKWMTIYQSFSYLKKLHYGTTKIDIVKVFQEKNAFWQFFNTKYNHEFDDLYDYVFLLKLSKMLQFTSTQSKTSDITDIVDWNFLESILETKENNTENETLRTKLKTLRLKIYEFWSTYLKIQASGKFNELTPLFKNREHRKLFENIHCKFTIGDLLKNSLIIGCIFLGQSYESIETKFRSLEKLITFKDFEKSNDLEEIKKQLYHGNDTNPSFLIRFQIFEHILTLRNFNTPEFLTRISESDYNLDDIIE